MDQNENEKIEGAEKIITTSKNESHNQENVISEFNLIRNALIQLIYRVQLIS